MDIIFTDIKLNNMLIDKNGNLYSDNTSTEWNAIFANRKANTYQILCEGVGNHEGKFKVLIADLNGIIDNITSEWLTENQLQNSYSDLYKQKPKYQWYLTPNNEWLGVNKIEKKIISNTRETSFLENISDLQDLYWTGSKFRSQELKNLYYVRYNWFYFSSFIKR